MPIKCTDALVFINFCTLTPDRRTTPHLPLHTQVSGGKQLLQGLGLDDHNFQLLVPFPMHIGNLNKFAKDVVVKVMSRSACVRAQSSASCLTSHTVPTGDEPGQGRTMRPRSCSPAYSSSFIPLFCGLIECDGGGAVAASAKE